MFRVLAVIAVSFALLFANGIASYAGETPSSPTEGKDKDKKGSGGHFSMSDDKDKKKDDKGGK